MSLPNRHPVDESAKPNNASKELREREHAATLKVGPASERHQGIEARIRGKGRCAFRPRAPRDACDYLRI